MWLADADHERYISTHPSLVLSPDGSREKITQIIDTAQNNIIMYAQSMDDPQIKKLLEKKKEE